MKGYPQDDKEVSVVPSWVETVRELLRPSSSKFKRLQLQFSSVQLSTFQFALENSFNFQSSVRSISKVQFVQFKVHSVQFSSTFSSGGRPPPPDEAAFSVLQEIPRAVHGQILGMGGDLDYGLPRGLKVLSNLRGVATKFCFGGRIHRHLNPPTPKI